jgi:hypothetical protein
MGGRGAPVREKAAVSKEPVVADGIHLDTLPRNQRLHAAIRFEHRRQPKVQFLLAQLRHLLFATDTRSHPSFYQPPVAQPPMCDRARKSR